MPHKFTINLEVSDDRFETPAVSIDGDVEKDGWEKPLLKGVTELLVLIRDIHGKEIVEKAVRKFQAK
jgi:hypothetical protein